MINGFRLSLMFLGLWTVSLYGLDATDNSSTQQLACMDTSVVLMSGDVADGIIVSVDDTTITLVRPDRKAITIPLRDISQMKLVRSVTAAVQCGTRRDPLGTDSLKSSQSSVAVTSLATSAAGQVPANAPPSKKPGASWRISIQPKASLSTGDQTQQTLGAQIVVRRSQHEDVFGWSHQSTTLTLDANNQLTEQSGSASVRTHEYDGDLEHFIYFQKRWYFNGVASGYHNSALNLYLAQFYGGGLGFKVIDSTTQNLTLTGNLVFMGEHFYGNVPSLGFAAARLTESYARTFKSSAKSPLIFTERFVYLPALNESKAWQLRGVSALVIPVGKTVSTNLSFFDDYIENAPKGRKNYSSSSVGLTFTFPPH